MDLNIFLTTLRSLSSLLSDFCREFGTGILGGVSDYLGEVSGGKMKEHKRENQGQLYMKKSEKNPKNPIR